MNLYISLWGIFLIGVLSGVMLTIVTMFFIALTNDRRSGHDS